MPREDLEEFKGVPGQGFELVHAEGGHLEVVAVGGLRLGELGAEEGCKVELLLPVFGAEEPFWEPVGPGSLFPQGRSQANEEHRQ
jgi:hypothetical protein